MQIWDPFKEFLSTQYQGSTFSWQSTYFGCIFLGGPSGGFNSAFFFTLLQVDCGINQRGAVWTSLMCVGDEPVYSCLMYSLLLS